MSTQPIPSFRAQRDLRKLGNDISIARKRRQFTQKQLAESASVNVSTIRRLENGDQGISLGTLAMVMLVLGESQRIADLLDVGRDDVGLTLGVMDLPKRVRGANRVAPVAASRADKGKRQAAAGIGGKSDELVNETTFDEGW
ncbi:MAG: helix-turn-helix transcriptional regulator [Acidithiobacillus sp.]